MDSFVIQLWGWVLSALKWLSPLEWIWFAFPKLRTHGWVDVWVLGNLVLAILTLFVASRTPSTRIVIGFLAYGSIRVLEIIVYQARVVLFDPLRQPRSTSDYAVRSYRRTLVLALHNYFETAVWFAAAYAGCRHLFGDKAPILATPVGALYYSMVTMVTLGYGEITPSDDWGRALVIVHLVVGVFMSLVILARFVSFLPVPRTLDDTEKSATQHPGTEMGHSTSQGESTEKK